MNNTNNFNNGFMTKVNGQDDSSYSFGKDNFLIPQMKLSLAIRRRKIFLYDVISETSIFEAIYFLDRLEEIDQKRGKKAPITIEICSDGGYVNDGWALINYIESLQKKGYEIYTVNIGKAYSMGLLISLCGTKKYGYTHSDFMYHQIRSYEMGVATVEDKRRSYKELERGDSLCIDYVISKTKLTKEFLEEKNKGIEDWFFDAKTALEYGVIDEIL